MGGAIGIFVNIPSILIMLTVPFALTLFTYGGEATFYALSTLISHFPPLIGELDDTVPLDVIVIKKSIVHVYAAAVLGLIIGSVQVLGGLNDLYTIGKPIATMLLCPFYAVLIAEGFLRPMAAHIVWKMESK